MSLVPTGENQRMKTIRAGVIGVGYLGQFHAEKYAGLDSVELVALADPDRERSAKIARKLGVQAFPDADKMLGVVDAVSIVAPTVRHHGIAKRFLDKGVHVLLEKPMTATVEEADELISISEKTGAVLQIGHIERFNPALTAIMPHLRAPQYLQAERSAPFTVRCTDVNVVLDLMIHDLDIVTDVAGSRPRAVSAAGASLITRGVDAVVARIVFDSGCTADVAASRVSDEKKRMLKVFDGNQLLTADFQNQAAFRSVRGTGSDPELETSPIPTERRDTLADEISSFLNCIRTGTRPVVGGTEGRSALALAEMITRNIDRGVSDFVSFS